MKICDDVLCHNSYIIYYYYGVHKKAPNIGVWGESGRLPLVFQSVRLSLNYLKPLENLRRTSFLAAALNQ